MANPYQNHTAVPTSPFGIIERFGCFGFYEALYSEVKVKVAYQVG